MTMNSERDWARHRVSVRALAAEADLIQKATECPIPGVHVDQDPGGGWGMDAASANQRTIVQPRKASDGTAPTGGRDPRWPVGSLACFQAKGEPRRYHRIRRTGEGAARAAPAAQRGGHRPPRLPDECPLLACTRCGAPSGQVPKSRTGPGLDHALVSTPRVPRTPKSSHAPGGHQTRGGPGTR